MLTLVNAAFHWGLLARQTLRRIDTRLVVNSSFKDSSVVLRHTETIM